MTFYCDSPNKLIHLGKIQHMFSLIVSEALVKINLLDKILCFSILSHDPIEKLMHQGSLIKNNKYYLPEKIGSVRTFIPLSYAKDKVIVDVKKAKED